MSMISVCRGCNNSLNDTNWYPSVKDHGTNLCIDCLKRRYKTNYIKRFENGGREKLILDGRLYRQNLKQETLSHYSNGTMACATCNFNNILALTIDHINGGGNKQRKELSIDGAGYHFYQWLEKNNYPYGYQVLCMNCNWIKGANNENITKDSKWRLSSKKYVVKLKEKVMLIYSPDLCCKNCMISDIRCLTIDHINNNGAEERKTKSWKSFLVYLRDNKPSGYQVLCFNCQLIKEYNYGRLRIKEIEA